MSEIQAISIKEDRPKRREIPKNLNLSVFNYSWSWKTWRGFWRNIAYFFKCIRPAWDRATKGYCRMDTWNVDYTFTAYLIKVLTEYRNVTNGWPDQYFATFEDFIAAIDQCIDELIFSIEDPYKLNTMQTDYEKVCDKPRSKWTKAEEALFEKYLDEVQKVYELQCQARERAFAFLGKYLPYIWW